MKILEGLVCLYSIGFCSFLLIAAIVSNSWLAAALSFVIILTSIYIISKLNVNSGESILKRFSSGRKQ